MTSAASKLPEIIKTRSHVFLRVLARRLGDMDLAEETLQDAVIHYERAAQKEIIENPEAYLMQIALNIAVDRIRQDASRRKREGRWFETHAPSRVGSEYVSATPSPDQALIWKQELNRLSLHIDELSPQVRKAFFLHKIQGFSHSDTAAEMGLSKSTVEKHIMKAMRILLEKMEKAAEK